MSNIPPPRRNTTTQIPSEQPRKISSTDKTQINDRATKEREHPSRVQAVLDVIGIAMMPLGVKATIDQIGRPENEISPYALDVYTIEQQSEPFAYGMDKLATNYPVVGAILDKVALLAPSGGLLTSVVICALQCAENHGKLPPNASSMVPGIVPRQELAQQVVADARDRMEMMANTNGHMGD